MSPDQQFWLAILAQFTATVTGLAVIYAKLHEVKASVNGRMDQLVEITATAGRAEGAQLAHTPSPELPVDAPTAPPTPVLPPTVSGESGTNVPD